MTAQKARADEETRTDQETRTDRNTRAGAESRADQAGSMSWSDRVALAKAVRDAVLAVDGVAGLGTTGPVEVATRYAGGKIGGIRLGDEVEVHVTVDPVPIGPVGERIQAAVRAVLERAGVQRPVEVVVDDVDLTGLAALPGR